MHRIHILAKNISSPNRNCLTRQSRSCFSSQRAPFHKMWSWGAGLMLGTGEKDDRHEPTLIEEFKKKRFISCSAGWVYTFAVTDKHEVYSWGKFSSGLLQPARKNDVRLPALCDQLQGKEIERVLAGRGHCMAVSKSGAVFSWGSCELGQRGHGVDGDDQELWLAGRVEPLSCPPAASRVVRLAVGLDHNIALTADQRLMVWGYGDEGQLGLGQQTLMSNVPVPLVSDRLKGKEIANVYCSGDFSALLTADGEVFVWGSNYHGQLGLGDTRDRYEPVHVNFFRSNPVRQVALGSAHMLLLTESGRLYSCGWGKDGRLGHGKEEDQADPTLVKALADQKIARIYAGGGQNFVVTEDGKVYAFGLGLNGRLGLGNDASVAEPTHMEFFDDKKLVDMSAGMDHSIAITVDE